MSACDAIVIGSGPSAVHAAWPLVHAGLDVVMVDVGNRPGPSADIVPDLAFSEIRETDPRQHRYFLGDELEGLPLGEVRVGAQLTPTRSFINANVEELTPARTEGFALLESLACGGLGAGWGAVAPQLDARDLADFPFGPEELQSHYEAVARRVGVSGDRDDLLPYYGDNDALQPPLELDSNAELLLERYARRRDRFRKAGLHVGRSRLAVLSRNLGDRSACGYLDMDFYSDGGRSVYRPAFTVEELSRRANFRYLHPLLAERFVERTDGKVAVHARDVANGAERTLEARRLIIAAGTTGTARIVLRSLDAYDTDVPLLANPYTYVPCVHWARLGKVGRDRRHSLSQLGIVYDPSGQGAVTHAQAFSYRSLLHFKLVKESFLAVRETFRVMRELLDAFVIFGIDHEDRPAPGKTCRLVKREDRAADGPADALEIRYAPTDEERRGNARREKQLLGLFRRLGCFPLRRIVLEPGSSIHYGGTFPMSADERDLTVTPDCLLRSTHGVYLADGSVFPYLPAKPYTFTLMANANRVGEIVARELRT